MLRSLFRKDQAQSQAETLYAAAAGQARAPEFYRSAGAPDTPEGRFDLLALHMFLIVDRLRRDAPASDRMVKLVQEVFFQNLDSALREMGVGDLSVGRKIRGLAEAFYGRYGAYERAIGTQDDALAGALARNILGTDDIAAGAALADYARAAREALSTVAVDELSAAVSGLSAISMRIFGDGRR